MDRLMISMGFVVPAIAACSPAHYVAERGREAVIGMDTDTLKQCAGLPTRTEQLNPRTTLYSYENKYERTGGAEVTLPIIGGGFSLGGSGSYCHAILRIADGKVAAVTYSGDNDDFIGREGICAPILRGCLREREKAGRIPREHVPGK
jgi:hypothetical protein